MDWGYPGRRWVSIYNRGPSAFQGNIFNPHPSTFPFAAASEFLFQNLKGLIRLIWVHHMARDWIGGQVRELQARHVCLFAGEHHVEGKLPPHIFTGANFFEQKGQLLIFALAALFEDAKYRLSDFAALFEAAIQALKAKQEGNIVRAIWTLNTVSCA